MIRVSSIAWVTLIYYLITTNFNTNIEKNYYLDSEIMRSLIS